MRIKPAVMTNLLESVIKLESVGENSFRPSELRGGLRNSTTVYGGQLVGQAMAAAIKTVPEGFYAHSFHSHFILAGDTTKPMQYNVEHLRDGMSTSARHVKASQDGNTVFGAQISLCTGKPVPKALTHQQDMPKVPLPDDLPDAETILKDLLATNTLSDEQTKLVHFRLKNIPESFDVRPVVRGAWERLRPMPPKYTVWLKLSERIEDTPTTHHCMAAYISDSAMVSTALLPHLKEGENTFAKVMMLSLDHSIWIHRPDFRVDEWVLYELESTVADNNRALIHGKLWTLDGRHVMSTAQEGLIRQRTL